MKFWLEKVSKTFVFIYLFFSFFLKSKRENFLPDAWNSYWIWEEKLTFHSLELAFEGDGGGGGGGGCCWYCGKGNGGTGATPAKTKEKDVVENSSFFFGKILFSLVLVLHLNAHNHNRKQKSNQKPNYSLSPRNINRSSTTKIKQESLEYFKKCEQPHDISSEPELLSAQVEEFSDEQFFFQNPE